MRRMALLAGLLAGIGGMSVAEVRAEAPVYEVYAVKYATMHQFKVVYLVAGADPDRTVELAMTVWLLKGPDGRAILVDSGFYRSPHVDNERVLDYTRPDRAIAALGIMPEQVTDVIITHMHWDHVDGADLFPKARIWIQKDEYDHYAGKNRETGAGKRFADPDYVTALIKLHDEGRVRLIDGDDKEIIPGITVYTGGRHTFASQYVGVNTRGGRMIVASDNMYLYENLDKHVPIAQTLDAKANLAAQDRMRQLAATLRMIIPGHDPEVFVRFAKPGNGVARLD